MDELAALRSWKGEPFTACALLLSALVYVRGWLALQHQVPMRFPQWRLISFLSGLAIVYLAVASPLDAFAGFLLQVHMVQHLLLTMVVPPLLLLGAPWLPILRGLPRVWVREVVGPLLNGLFWKTLAGFFAHPVTSWLLFVGSNVLWHLPPFYEAALRSDNWHAFEHACFLGTALLFWWHVVLPWPAHPRWSRWMAIPYLLLADLQNTALGAFLSFYDHPLYPGYQAVPRLWGIDVMTDQSTAGAIMWVPGSVAFLVPAGMIAIKLLAPKRGSRFLDSQLQTPAPLRIKKPSWFIRMARTPVRRMLQVVLLLLAVLVVLDGFFGPKVASMNLAGVLPWTYWRGLGVIALLTIGNFFCSVCPFVLARDLARRAWAPGWLWPKTLRNKWSAVGLLATFLWAYEVFDLWNRPVWTAVLILGYFASAIVIDVLFRGASFCKYLCPIGQYHFAFSTNSSTEIGILNPQVCAGCQTHDCLRGNERDRGCELHLFQPSKAGNVDCTGCLDCVRACPVDNVDLVAVVPARDLASDRFRSTLGRYSQRGDLAALFGLFVIGALVNATGMIAPVTAATASLVTRFGIPETVVTSLLFVTVFAGLIATGWLAAAISNSTHPRQTLISFTPAFVPLGASVWAAHFLFHFATGAFTIIPVTQRFLGDLGFQFAGAPDWTWMGFRGDGIMGIELALLNAGVLGSLYLAWQISEREGNTAHRFRGFLPWAVLILLIFAWAVWTMFQPMDMRGTMMSGH